MTYAKKGMTKSPRASKAINAPTENGQNAGDDQKSTQKRTHWSASYTKAMASRPHSVEA